MSGLNEEIARLTGRLVFSVDRAGFQNFNQLMKRATQQMSTFSSEFAKLSNKMAKGLKLNIDTSAADKAKAKLDNALKRQHRAEVALGNQQRQTFSAELSQQKLKYAGTKQQAQLTSSLLQAQKDASVIAAKAHAKQMKAAGVTKQQLASQNAITASMTRQARLDAIVQKARAAAQKASAQHLASMGRAQRLQQVMSQAATTAQARQQKHSAQMANMQQASANRATKQAQQTQRFQWAQARQQQWQANQNAGGGIGAMGGLMALGGIGAVIGGLSAAIGALSNRVQERQQGVQDAEGFNNTFMSISKDPAIVKLFRDSFMKSQNDNGGTIDTDTAKDFRTLAINMAAAGKTLDKITETWNVRQQAFSVAGTSKEDNKELNKQLGQMASDGTGAASDANIINDRMPMLTPYVVREYMKDKNIKDYNKGLGAYNTDLKGGKGVKFSWYDQGMRNLVKDNGDSLERNRNSVATAQQRADNQAFLNTNAVNTNSELTGVIKERIQAERELNEAMQPLNNSLANFDLALTKLTTGVLRQLTGKNADGSRKTSEEQAAALSTAGGADGTLSLPTIVNPPTTQQNLDAQANDPINRFWSWIGVGKDARQAADENRANWEGITPSVQQPLPGFLPQLQLNMGQIAELYKQSESSVFDSAKSGRNTGTQINAPITVEGAKINIELHGSATDEDHQRILSAMSAELDKQNQKIPSITQQAVADIFGRARSLQAERY